MWLPSADDLIEMHDRIIAEHGGEPGVLRRGAIEAAIERARYGPFPVREPDLAWHAAMLMRGIAQDHPFVDGNKRTGYEAASIFLDLNGALLDAPRAASLRLVVNVAQGRLGIDDIAQWLERWCRTNL